MEILPDDRAQALIALCWGVEKLDSADAIAKAATGVA